MFVEYYKLIGFIDVFVFFVGCFCYCNGWGVVIYGFLNMSISVIFNFIGRLVN